MINRILVAIPGIAVILAAVYFGGPVFAAFALVVALAGNGGLSAVNARWSGGVGTGCRTCCARASST